MMTSFPPAPIGTNDQLSPIRSSRPSAVGQVGAFRQTFAQEETRNPIVTLMISTARPAGAGQLGAIAGPDDVILGFRRDGQFEELARLDGRYLSAEVAGGFTGRVLGVAAIESHSQVIRFEYQAQSTQ